MQVYFQFSAFVSMFLWIVSHVDCLLYVLLLAGLYFRAYDSQCAKIYQIIKCTVVFKSNSVMIMWAIDIPAL